MAFRQLHHEHASIPHQRVVGDKYVLTQQGKFERHLGEFDSLDEIRQRMSSITHSNWQYYYVDVYLSPHRNVDCLEYQGTYSVPELL